MKPSGMDRIVNIGLRARTLLCIVLVLGSQASGAADGREVQSRHAERVFGYTDDSGTTILTNVPEKVRGPSPYRLLVDLPESGPSPGGGRRGWAPAELPVSAELRRWVEQAAREQGVDAALVYAVMAQESGYNPQAVSPKGAKGLMQLMPQTGQTYGVKDFFNSRESIFAGAQHLRHLLDEFQGDLSLALAAYNAGSNAVIRYHNEIPPFSETQAYVPRVLDIYERFRLASQK